VNVLTTTPTILPPAAAAFVSARRVLAAAGADDSVAVKVQAYSSPEKHVMRGYVHEIVGFLSFFFSGNNP
jgi:hypothetical protein